MPIVARNTILELHRAAIECGLADTRDALLSAIDPVIRASLRTMTPPGAQMLSDLHSLNRHRDVSLPLRCWLESAIALSGNRIAAGVFRDVLSTLPSPLDGPARIDPGKIFGREYLFDAVESFMADERSGYLSIQGASGSGKTAFLSEYSRRSGCTAHFNDPATGVTQAAQLAQGIGEQICDRFGLAGFSTTAWARRADALVDLLKRCAAQLSSNDPLVIAIDAVDDGVATAPGANALRLPETLPDHVYFLLTHRAPLSPFTVKVARRIIDMRAHHEENEADVRAFLCSAVSAAEISAWLDARSLRVDDFVSELVRRSDGNFMYLHLILRAISEGRYQGHALTNLPRDLHTYYEERWQGLELHASPPRAQRNAIAYVLTEAKRPLSQPEIVRLTGTTPAAVCAVAAEIHDLLRVSGESDETNYAIAHASFREFLYWRDSVQAAGMALAGNESTIEGTLTTLLGAWHEATSRGPLT